MTANPKLLAANPKLSFSSLLELALAVSKVIALLVILMVQGTLEMADTQSTATIAGKNPCDTARYGGATVNPTRENLSYAASPMLEDVERQAEQLTKYLTVIVPCYNEAATIEKVLVNLRAAAPHAQLIVVDDGSTDATLDRIHGLAQMLMLEIIRLPSNQGKGAAVRVGIGQAAREYTIIQDADLEYFPIEILGLLKTAIVGQRIAVFGCRYSSGRRPAGVPLGNFFAVKIFQSYCGAVLAFGWPIRQRATSSFVRKSYVG